LASRIRRQEGEIPADFRKAGKLGSKLGFPQMSPDQLPNDAPVVSRGSERFLRGAQVTDEQGRCEFISIYPRIRAFLARQIGPPLTDAEIVPD